jgi:hypothetical protein
METELQNEAPRRCPVCGLPAASGEFCKHLITCLCDDADGSECLAPLYFANGQMVCAFDDLYLAITRFGIAWLDAGRERRRELEGNASNLEPALRTTFRHVINQLRKFKSTRLADVSLNDYRDLEDYVDCVILNLEIPLRELFDTFFENSQRQSLQPVGKSPIARVLARPEPTTGRPTARNALPA